MECGRGNRSPAAGIGGCEVKRWAFFGAGVLVFVIAAAILLSFGRPAGTWTTDSPEALTALEQGLTARGKVYLAEAGAHFRRALEHDPDFVAPKAMLLGILPARQQEERRELISRLREADLDRLSARERFLVRHTLAVVDGAQDQARAIVDEYLGSNPQDPFALEAAMRYALVLDEEPELIAGLAQRLLLVDPNWALAYNWLGYHALGRGEFAEAEKMFTTYRYIAPDQANPHDSLAELFMLRGRYDEAREELEAAISARADFWFSYRHLGLLALLQRDAGALFDAAERAADAGAPPELQLQLECLARAWVTVEERRWEDTWLVTTGECSDLDGPINSYRFLAALATGRDREAAKIEEQAAAAAAEARSKGVRYARGHEATVHHLAGFRLLAENRPGPAAEEFKKAAYVLTYASASEGHFKLTNLLFLAQALRQAGESDEAALVVEQIREVNEPFLSFLEDPLPPGLRGRHR